LQRRNQGIVDGHPRRIPGARLQAPVSGQPFAGAFVHRLQHAFQILGKAGPMQTIRVESHH
jgi:hypothetical protein